MPDTKIMFKVGNTDYSNRVLSETYSVQSDDEYTEWTDANYTTHRELVRRRISGSFEMMFPNIEEFDAFTQVIAENKSTNLSVPCIVYDNVYHREVNADLFIDFSPTRYRTENWSDRMKNFTVKITER